MSEFDAAEAAVQAALDAGATYADARVMHRRYESMTARNGEVEDVDQSEDAGIGVRALVGSGWGFYAVPDIDDASARLAGSRAMAIAASSATVSRAATPLLAGEAHVGSWASDCVTDPLDVSLTTKGDMLTRASATMASHGADLAEAMYQIWDTAKWFVSSEGARIDQRVRECGAGIMATSIGDGETQRRSYPAARGQYGTQGWELVTEIDIEAHAARVAEESRALLSAPLCPSGETTLILGGEQMALQIHESVGHAIELDRILGWEAAYAGTSWLDLAKLGALQYGSELMNITIDPTIPGALGSFGYDDEGTAATQRDAVRNGTWVGVLAGRDSAAVAGLDYAGSVALGGLGSAADGADDERRSRAGPAHAGRDHRRHRRRHLHGDQPLVVDRRQAAQLPVRHRGRLRGQGRPARAAGAQPDVHRDRTAVLAFARHAVVGDRGLGDAELRQGSTGPDRPHRPPGGARPVPQRARGGEGVSERGFERANHQARSFAHRCQVGADHEMTSRDGSEHR